MEREQHDVQQTQAIDAQESECDNPHKKVRAPMEEKKEIIYECLKFLGMKYTPPPLSVAATSSVPKNDAALYGIQMALANLTRPIDDYVHSKLKSPTTIIQGNEDLEFAHTMRELLSDVASSITQSKINNLKKLIEL
ncbi:hypothetical protein BB561_004998 [Smittium simulii]|uniref:Uncharacterized protein n=1 Tax=Smittium simulii TaxID=133385 RepID=A0A2T9YCX5_9FUNG|nr:hypothetical protein BB561_004998 [Smittium simulii]